MLPNFPVWRDMMVFYAATLVDWKQPECFGGPFVLHSKYKSASCFFKHFALKCRRVFSCYFPVFIRLLWETRRLLRLFIVHIFGACETHPDCPSSPRHWWILCEYLITPSIGAKWPFTQSKGGLEPLSSRLITTAAYQLTRVMFLSPYEVRPFCSSSLMTFLLLPLK